MERRAVRRRGNWPAALTAIALAWSGALVVGALVVSVYSVESASSSSERVSTTATLVGENGLWVLLPVAVPAALTTVAWIALRWRCSRGGALSITAAWTSVGLLAVLSVLAMFSIGIFVLPVVVLLALAAALTPDGASRRSAAPSSP